MRRSCLALAALLLACAASRPGTSTNVESCAAGWMPIQRGVCVRFSKLEQGDDPGSNLVAMDLLSRTGFLHLGLRVAVFRGAQELCAFPGVLSLSRIEADRQYAFRVPCNRSGNLVEKGESRLVVEVDEAIAMPHQQ